MSGTKRISALTELASGSVDEDDILAIVDMSQASVTDKTKHVKVKNLIAVGGRLEIDSFAELATKFVGSSPSSTQQIAATNDIVVWREKGFRYQCVTSGEHFDYTGSGGLKWKVLPDNGGELNFEAFGCVGDDSTDNATAAQAAIDAAIANSGTLRIPKGTFRSSETLVVDGACIIAGTGRTSLLKGTGTNKSVLKWGNTAILFNSGIRDMRIMSDTGAGHCIEFPTGCSTCFFENIDFIQYNDGKSILYGSFASTSGMGIYDTRFAGGSWYMPDDNGATVAGVHISTNGTLFNENIFENLRVYYAGSVQFFNIQQTNATAWNMNNTFKNINAEVCNGGVIKASSARKWKIQNLNVWDTTTITDHIIHFNDNTYYDSSENVIENYNRTEGTLDSGKRDIYLEDAQDTVIISGGVNTPAGSSYDFASKRFIWMGLYPATVNNAQNGTILGTVAGFVRNLDAYDLTITASDRSADIATISGSSATILRVLMSANSSSIQLTAKDSGGTNANYNASSVGWFPVEDNVRQLGQAGARWTYVHAYNVRTHGVTVANLPAAGTAGAGTRAFVTDATATTFASTVAGGGANAVPVYSDGTNWKIG